MPTLQPPLIQLPPSPTARPLADVLTRQTALSSPLSDKPDISHPGSRRRRLWELPHKLHCPVIGVCFDIDELRACMGKLLHLPRDASDFLLHTSAVGSCESRSPLAAALHKKLEKQFSMHIRRFSTAKNPDQLRSLWREACADGCEIPAALWAAVSHPACDAPLEQEIYGEIHMIQHQLGSTTRHARTVQEKLRHENLALRGQLAATQSENERLRQKKSQEIQRLNQQLAQLQTEQAGRIAQIDSLNKQLLDFQQHLPALKDRQILAERAEQATRRAQALERENLALTAEIRLVHKQWREPTTTCHDAPPPDETPVARMRRLDGKCILCVGGRAGAVDAFRLIVEKQGGRFLHHDGGQEESLHRIDGALSAADLVVCQAGCISHNAYWRVKERCKRSGKQCHYVKGSGVSSFNRIVDMASDLSSAEETV